MPVLLLLALSAAAGGDWEYRPGVGFIDPSTMERKTPEEFLQHGLALRKVGDTRAAVRVFALIVQNVKEAGLSESARFEEAETRFQAGEFFEACRGFEEFVARTPQSDRATAAKRRVMDAALEMAHHGHTENVLGLPLLSSPKAGVEKLREVLRRYPREDFSAEFYQLLGLFFFGRGELDSAEVEFTTVLEQYPDSPLVVPALYHLGLCRRDRFDDVPYDVKPLKEAKRHFERFIEEADRMRRLSTKAEEWVNRYLPEVRTHLARIHELLAEKELRAAEYYRWKGYPHSAAISYREILRTFPATRAAARSRERLLEMGEAAAPDPRPPASTDERRK
jgi:outer membrane protein assembly factor BamD (BamD/ComL family)